eukprot:scaffold1237_cov243-Pinguiococcus_pyrenoidosus.AAC.14
MGSRKAGLKGVSSLRLNTIRAGASTGYAPYDAVAPPLVWPARGHHQSQLHGKRLALCFPVRSPTCREAVEVEEQLTWTMRARDCR